MPHSEPNDTAIATSTMPEDGSALACPDDPSGQPQGGSQDRPEDAASAGADTAPSRLAAEADGGPTARDLGADPNAHIQTEAGPQPSKPAPAGMPAPPPSGRETTGGLPDPRSRWDHYLEWLFANGACKANYLVNWSTERQYIYVETPKVACTAVKRVLQTAAQGGAEPAANVHDRLASPLPRVSEEFDAFMALCDAPDTFRFCFVRNPFTRILSCYLDKFVKNDWERARLAPTLGFGPDAPPSFRDFLEAVRAQPEHERDIHWATQVFLLRPNRFRYSFIGRFELFDAQFAKICRELDLDYAPKPSDKAHATSAGAALAEHLGPEEADLLRDIYADDFRFFGYGWSPRVV